MNNVKSSFESWIQTCTKKTGFGVYVFPSTVSPLYLCHLRLVEVWCSESQFSCVRPRMILRRSPAWRCRACMLKSWRQVFEASWRPWRVLKDCPFGLETGETLLAEYQSLIKAIIYERGSCVVVLGRVNWEPGGGERKNRWAKCSQTCNFFYGHWWCEWCQKGWIVHP